MNYNIRIMRFARYKRVQVIVLDPSNALVSFERGLEIRGYKVARKTTPESITDFINTNKIKRFVVLSSPSLSKRGLSSLSLLSEVRWPKNHSVEKLSKGNIKNSVTLTGRLDQLLTKQQESLIIYLIRVKPYRAFFLSILASCVGSAAWAFAVHHIELRDSPPEKVEVTADGYVAPNPENLKLVPVPRR